MHGPRAPGSSRDSLRSRCQCSKSITFHEECDIVEFEPNDKSNTSCAQQDRHDDNDGFFGIPKVEGESEQVEEDSFDDIPLNLD